LFPDGVLSLRIFEVRYLKMVKSLMREDSTFGVLMLEDGQEVLQPDKREKLRRVGTLAKITEVNTLQPALLLIRCKGVKRFRLNNEEKGRYGLWSGEIEMVEADPSLAIPQKYEVVVNTLGKLIADMQKKINDELSMPIAPPFRLDECGWVANRWSEILPLSPKVKQDLLEEMNPSARLDRVFSLLSEFKKY
tara:strand:+ start:9586 stop:10161 length:576 start_codon:yes stop_codon:yes gene_type:complete